jgi:hypothetical protein
MLKRSTGYESRIEEDQHVFHLRKWKYGSPECHVAIVGLLSNAVSGTRRT